MNLTTGLNRGMLSTIDAGRLPGINAERSTPCEHTIIDSPGEPMALGVFRFFVFMGDAGERR